MLESLINFDEIHRKPYIMFIWSIVVCSIAILVSTQVAYSVDVAGTSFSLGGFFAVLFTIIPSVYFITLMIKREEAFEEKEIEKKYKKSFWHRHEQNIYILLLFFAGLTLAFALWSMVLPENFFQIQSLKISDVRGAITGLEIGPSTLEGYAINEANFFNRVLMNNLQVLVFAFIFSFIFGAGSVFIIAWNASVLGVYIGQLSKVLWEVPIIGLAFLPHGIPEIAGYIAASLSGGLLSAAIIRKNKPYVLRMVAFESLKIFMLAIGLIVLGAFIETYV
ncbi:MAG: stage II sporulation protein M [Candidatus Aenigmatarchaeota archaeon]